MQFGKAHNRRLCYVIELDKNPTESTYNPISASSDMSADAGSDNYQFIEFLEPVQSVLLSDLNKFPAIWEVDPKKQEVDLDIYYEASSQIPVKLNSETNELFAPIGCKVEIVNNPTAGSAYLEHWEIVDGISVANFSPGFKRDDGVDEIDYSGTSFKFTRQDGSFTIAEAGQQQLIGLSNFTLGDYKIQFDFKEEVGSSIRVGLSWYNCFSFGNGLESNRIKDGFNEMFITNGVKVSTTIQETYKEEHRAHGLIYSGLYNSNSGLNDLNQFIMAEKITKDLNPTYGSIQKLFSRDTDLVTFCEDKVLKVLANKDAVFNADGNPQLTANQNVLGQTVPFVGDYGISKNPESFASETYRAYFTDKQRGAVLRLSRDGLTPISKAGMHDWFRDNLPKYSALVGTYDAYKEDYNITLSNVYTENILEDTFLSVGEMSSQISGSVSNKVENGGVYSGTNAQYVYDYMDILTNTAFDGLHDEDIFKGTVTITNHAEIDIGDIQGEVLEALPQTGIGAVAEEWTAYQNGVVVGTGGSESSALSGANPGLPTTTTNFGMATYSSNLPNSGGNIPGQIWAPDFEGTQQHIFGTTWSVSSSSSCLTVDPDIIGNIRRQVFRGNIGSFVDESTPNTHPSHPSQWASSRYTSTMNPSVAKPICYGAPYATANNQNYSQTITRGKATNTSTYSFNSSSSGGDNLFFPTTALIFDRPHGNSKITSSQTIGQVPTGYGSAVKAQWKGMLQDTYVNSVNAAGGSLTNTEGQYHNAVYNGDEIIVQIELLVVKTHEIDENLGPNQQPNYYDLTRIGKNYIKPEIELFDGSTAIPNSAFVQGITLGDNTNRQNWLQELNSGTQDPYRFVQNPPDIGGLTPFVGQNNTATAAISMSLPYEYHYAYPSGVYQNQPAIYESSRVVSFNTTEDISDLTINRYTSNNVLRAKNSMKTEFFNKPTGTVTIQACFKFKDSSQQNADGSWNGTSGDGIEETKVINNLVVQLRNTNPAGGSAYSTGYATENLEWPLWGVKSMKIFKAFGVTNTHTNFVQGYPLSANLTQAYDPGSTINGIHYVAPVPPQKVPAWTEVEYSSNHGLVNWQRDLDPLSVGNAKFYSSAQDISNYGIAYNSVTETGLLQDSTDQGTYAQVAPTETVTYKVPEDWVHLNSPGSGTGAYTASSSFQHGSVFGTSFSPDASSTNSTSGSGGLNASNQWVSNPPSTINYDNTYLYIETDSGEAVDIKVPITGDPWQSGSWYLIDIEYDFTFNNNTGAGGGDGTFHILGVADHANFSNGVEISPNGVGVFSGANSYANCQMVRTTRTEYDTNTSVVRGIFKFHPNSWRAQSQARRDIFVVRCYEAGNGVKIKKIIARKINILPTVQTTIPYGGASNWEGKDNYTPSVHSFMLGGTYFHSDKLCFEHEDTLDSSGSIMNKSWSYFWVQDFGAAGNQSAPEITPNGWTLKFTIGDNPRTGESFTGKIRGGVGRDASGDNPAPNNGTQGIWFQGIEDAGNYEINFTMDGDDSSWSITRDNVNYSAAILIILGNYGNLPSANSLGNEFIAFMDNSSGNALKASISNITLSDNTIVFRGGSAGSWNINGFDTSAENYVYWDQGLERITFENMPAIDPQSSLPAELININQWIEKPINRYNKYRIKFDYHIDTADIVIYYFNKDGYGFRITNLGAYQAANNANAYDTNLTGTSITGTYDKVHTIGEKFWNNDGLSRSEYNAELKETFVIRKGSGVNLLNGWIDNISMTQEFDLGPNPQLTVSFNENVNGWTSFKSFYDSNSVPLENGISLSKKYFTINKGSLYQHYVPMLDGVHEYTNGNGDIIKYTAEEANNYNTFYNNFVESRIKLVLNTEPSTVKTFNTLNYEGTQSFIYNPTPSEQLTSNNIKAYNAGQNISGWYCDDIKTDLDVGTVKEFIEKEGKWFNYIKGKNIGLSGAILDTSRFSTQGIGIASSVSSVALGQSGGIGSGPALGGGTGNGGASGSGPGGSGTGNGGTGGGGTGGGTGGGGTGGGGY